MCVPVCVLPPLSALPRTTGFAGHKNQHVVKECPAALCRSLSVKILYIHDGGRGKKTKAGRREVGEGVGGGR